VSKLAVLALAALGIVAFLTHGSLAARAQVCGLPEAKPLWIDYAEGSVSFRNEAFGRPGVVAGTSGAGVPAALRNAGAQTIYWWGRLGNLVGTTTNPADPATIADQAGKLVDRAVTSSGCTTPLIVLNELNGPGTTTPWTPNNAQYRANVLNLVRGIAARGARPLLLLPSAPYTGGEALDWWHQVAQVSDIVPEVYFKAPRIMRLGVTLGSRRMREAYRSAILALAAINVPVSRIGIVIGFQSGPGTGGREGLQPSGAWFRFVKLQTLAAKQVAEELGIAEVVSWGWGTFSEAGADADKPAAACVYLWARSEELCDGPAAAGDDFNASLDEGQILLPAGARCVLDDRPILRSSVGRLTAITRDNAVAFTALFARVVDSERAPIAESRVLEAERSVIDHRFGGSRSAYTAALSAANANAAVARGVIADGLRRARIESSLVVPTPTAAQVQMFYDTYPDAPVRHVNVTPAPSWLPSGKGFVVLPPGPAQLLDLPEGVPSNIVIGEGSFEVTPTAASLPLGAIPLELVRPAIRRALTSYARADAFEAWTVAAQEKALNRISCARDALPQVGSVDLSAYLPFLAADA
jgi:hypothetical protein